MSPKGGEGPRAGARPRCHGDAPSTHRCSAALSPRRETKAPHRRPGFIAQGSPRGQSGAAHGTRRRLAKAVETRARNSPLGAVGARRRARAEAADGWGGVGRAGSRVIEPTPPPALTWPAPPKAPPPEGGLSAKPRMRKRRRALATANGGREGNMAAVVGYRRLYWRLQQWHPAQLPLQRPCRATGHTDSQRRGPRTPGFWLLWPATLVRGLREGAQRL